MVQAVVADVWELANKDEVESLPADDLKAFFTESWVF